MSFLRSLTFLILGLAIIISVKSAATPFGSPIEELTLKDGTVLHHVVVMSFSAQVLMAKWDGGRGTIRIENLPDDLRAQASAIGAAADNKKPLNTTPGSKTDRPLPESTPLPLLRPFETHAVVHSDPVPRPMPQSFGDVGPVSRTIHGQCFIVTGAGSSVKLALVAIRACGAAEFNDADLWAGSYIKTSEMYQKSDKAASTGNFALAELYIQEAGDAIAYRWDKVSAPIPTAKTDADGKFELKINFKGPFIIFANAKRLVSDQTERYEWQVPSSEISESGELMLTNDNLLKGR